MLYNDATAVDIPTGSSVALNLTDPDSLTIDPRGNLVLESQGDSELVFIRPGTTNSGQEVGRILITTPPSMPTTVDDTAFAPKSRRAFLLAADINGNTVYRIDSPTFGFEPGVAYSASDTAGIIGVLDLDNGILTPVITSNPVPPSAQISSFRGLLFATPAEEADERHDKREARRTRFSVTGFLLGPHSEKRLIRFWFRYAMESSLAFIFSASVTNCLTLSLISSRTRRKTSVFWPGNPSSEFGSTIVLVVQLFQKVPGLMAVAPTQSEPPFVVSQIAVLAIFIIVSVFAAIRYREAQIRPA